MWCECINRTFLVLLAVIILFSCLIVLYWPGPTVPLVPCRSITTCASHGSTTSTAVHLIYNGSVPGYLQSCHSSRRRDVKTTVMVLCLPSSGSTASSSLLLAGSPALGRRACPVSSSNNLPSHVTSYIVLHGHLRFSYSVSKHPYFSAHT